MASELSRNRSRARHVERLNAAKIAINFYNKSQSSQTIDKRIFEKRNLKEFSAYWKAGDDAGCNL